MPNYIRDVAVNNIVLDDDAIKELDSVVRKRIDAHNQSSQDPKEILELSYVVRFDNRGYRTLSVDEAWNYYKTAHKLERVVFEANCIRGVHSNHQAGARIVVYLDTMPKAISHVIVSGESRDWVEATFSALDASLARRKSLATRVARTEWMALVMQLTGVLVGVLLCLWLATMSAPYLKDIDYPRAVSFGLWFLVYSNLWTYLQRIGTGALDSLFPSVRFSREGEGILERLARKAVEAGAIALGLYLLGKLSSWALSVLAPYIL